ncbi:receptor-type tyrosine-protein phosphatase H [Sebastes fasciatus]|uniref:receptor-type tyrosine-protein phosphatase H n=1 Tax=Sebastes fasciatus TaxID=394691 RepID=UPI003D9E6D42
MGNLSLKDKSCFLIFWTLVLMCSAVQQDYYFHDWRNVTWDQARNHCQVCFKELVTLTPENIQTISQNLSSDCWVGLRKTLYPTSNSSMPWSRWADGKPLIFQNWNPGSPVLKSSSSRRYCCPCPAKTTKTFTTQDVTSFSGPGDNTTATDISSFTSDVTDQTVTDQTGLWVNTTHNPPPATAAPTARVEAECVKLPDVNETDGRFINDSCVAMLSFGAWVEKDCSELLPFICYEDRFFGLASVITITSENASLTWQPGPGDISHYRVEVRADGEQIQKQTDKLTLNLGSLKAGTRYSVQVFPVKCNRDLNPQEIAFYTIPNKVENLTDTNVTESSVFLSWNKPAGNVDFYLIKFQGGKQIKSYREDTEIDSLTPGKRYTFTVLSGVGDNSTWSEETNITAYTKPGKVSNLRVTNITDSSLQLKWVRPEGETECFSVKAMNDTNNTLFDQRVTETEVIIPRLPMGTRITCSVTALTDNGKLEGDKVTVTNYTAPGSISDLILDSTHNSINATWKSSAGSSSSFTVELQLDGKNVTTIHNLKEPRKHFDKLKFAANYTVIVYTVSGHIKSLAVERSKFTGVVPPTNAAVISSNKKNITFQWKAPDNIVTARYSVRINSSFWDHNQSDTVEDKTTYTFVGLESGTRYDFEVRLVADGKSSTPATVSVFTVAEKREITLSMLCSSDESLLCDKYTTRDDVYNQLHEHFYELLGDNVFWKLEKLENENR